MKDTAKTILMIYLSKLEDPRAGKNTRHKFIEIVFIAICTAISGCECWTEIEDYGKAKKLAERFFKPRKWCSFS